MIVRTIPHHLPTGRVPPRCMVTQRPEPRRMPRPLKSLFYFRRFLRAFSALSTPLFEPPSLPLPFFSPDILSLAAFFAAPSIFLPMPAMLATLLCVAGVFIYSHLYPSE